MALNLKCAGHNTKTKHKSIFKGDLGNAQKTDVWEIETSSTSNHISRFEQKIQRTGYL